MADLGREYNLHCGLAKAMELVGSRWGMLILRNLFVRPCRFKDLELGLPGIPPNVLSTRLRELEAAGIVERRVSPSPADRIKYHLTGLGREIEPAMLSLAAWGARSLDTAPGDQELSAETLAVMLQACFDPASSAGVDLTCVLELTSGPNIVVRIGDSRLQLSLGDDPAATLQLHALENLEAVMRRHVEPDSSVGRRLIKSGSVADLKTLVDCFSLPVRWKVPADLQAADA